MPCSLVVPKADQIQFLLASVEDQQGTIRAIDFKAEVLLIAMTVPLMNTSGISATMTALGSCNSRPVAGLSHAMALILMIGWFFAFLCILATIFAKHDPAAAIADRSGARGSFYSDGLFRVTWRHLFFGQKIATSTSVASHLKTIPETEDEIAQDLVFEQMKLASICARKIGYFNYSIRAAGASVVAGAILFILHLFC